MESIPITLKLTTESNERGHKDIITIKEDGHCYQAPNRMILRFIEHQEEGEDIQTTVTIQEDRVAIRRTGPVQMHQVFIPKQWTENTYHHPYGLFYMQTKTDHIEHQFSSKSEKGRLFITYLLRLNQEEEQEKRQRLTLTYQRRQTQ